MPAQRRGIGGLKVRMKLYNGRCFPVPRGDRCVNFGVPSSVFKLGSCGALGQEAMLKWSWIIFSTQVSSKPTKIGLLIQLLPILIEMVRRLVNRWFRRQT